MLELKTDFGTFGNFKDMARYMEEEGISEVTVKAYYIFDKVVELHFTLEEVQKLASRNIAETDQQQY